MQNFKNFEIIEKSVDLLKIKEKSRKISEICAKFGGLDNIGPKTIKLAERWSKSAN